VNTAVAVVIDAEQRDHQGDGADRTQASSRSYGMLVWLAALAALAVYAFIFFYVRTHVFHGNSDFACFYRAGKMLRAGETGNIYNLAVETQYDRRWASEYAVAGRDFPTYPFVSPPFFLLVLGGLARLSYAHAWAVWSTANVAMLLGIPLLLRNALGRGKLMALALLAPPFFLPLDFALFRGQVVILLAFLFSWMFAELARGRFVRAGCILALIALKPQLALPMLLALVVARNWRAVAAFLGTGLVLTGVSVALVGWGATLGYPKVLAGFDRLPQELWGPQPQRMANARGFFYTLLHARLSEHGLGLLTFIASLGLVLLVSFALQRRTALNLGFALVLVITLLTSYHAYSYDLALLLPAFLLTGSYLRGRRLGPVEVTLAFTVYALFLFPAMAVSFPVMVVGMFLGMLLLAAMQALALSHAGGMAAVASCAQVESRRCIFCEDSLIPRKNLE
jgi:hypothetical protein